MIDVKELIARFDLQDLIKSADEYFSVHADIPRLMQKPFNDLDESTETVLTFLHVVKGLRLEPRARVLDFGAGSGWTSRILAGFGYEVIATDVSHAALDIGRNLMAAQPPFVNHHPVRFLPFDGKVLAIEDASIDAVCCISAFHHTHNPHDVIREFARILKPWGVAGLSEPGPQHSRTPASQWEMSNYAVIENDVVIEEVWQTAQAAGFNDLDLCVFNPIPKLVSLEKFNHFVAGAPMPDWEQETRNLMVERRLFFMEKGEAGVGSSKDASGLSGRIEIDQSRITSSPGASVSLKVIATNDGASLWRPSDWFVGPVRVGPKLRAPDGTAYLPRWMMPKLPRRGVLPGESVEVTGTVVMPAATGRYELELQMVSEMVAWFGPIARVEVIVQ